MAWWHRHLAAPAPTSARCHLVFSTGPGPVFIKNEVHVTGWGVAFMSQICLALSSLAVWSQFSVSQARDL